MKIFNEEQIENFLQLRRSLGGKFKVKFISQQFYNV